MDVDDVLLSPQDELLQLQQTLDLLAKDQEKMEAGIIKLHKRNRNIHETEVKYVRINIKPMRTYISM